MKTVVKMNTFTFLKDWHTKKKGQKKNHKIKQKDSHAIGHRLSTHIQVR